MRPRIRIHGSIPPMRTSSGVAILPGRTFAPLSLIGGVEADHNARTLVNAASATMANSPALSMRTGADLPPARAPMCSTPAGEPKASPPSGNITNAGMDHHLWARSRKARVIAVALRAHPVPTGMDPPTANATVTRGGSAYGRGEGHSLAAGQDSPATPFPSYCRAHISSDATVSDLERLKDGWETDVFAFTLTSDGQSRPLVLRIYSGEGALLRARSEHHVLTTLHSTGYPVPDLLHFQPDDRHLGGPFLVMERVPGRSLQSHLGAGSGHLGLFFDLLARLHRLDPRPFIGCGSPWPTLENGRATFSLGWLSGNVERAGLATAFAPLVEWLDDQGRRIQHEHAVIHGDFHPLNILVAEDGRATVIDWGSACIADPRIDVANAAVLARALGQPALAPLIKQGYEAVLGTRLSDLEYFESLVLARRLAVMAIAMMHGSRAAGLRAGAEEHLRQHCHLAAGVLAGLESLTGLVLVDLRQELARLR